MKRAFTILCLAGVAGCGASQAAPTVPAAAVQSDSTPDAPKFSIVADTAGTAAVSNAAFSALLSGPTGWQIEFVQVRGSLAALQGQTFNMPSNGAGGGSAFIYQGATPFANVHIHSDSTTTRMFVGRVGGPLGVKTSFGHNNNALQPRPGLGLQSMTNGAGITQDGAVVNLIPY